ncbi:MAG: F0F1 ATP synthase subunit B [Ignavibacteriaceae bacterium]|nr:F0F1 ATP synthase subunit B [Ignavibacteriaceae bacterium]NUM70007.1 F0F1 ATP synthase subunit B [Ignavibacteriaceae bacterium]
MHYNLLLAFAMSGGGGEDAGLLGVNIGLAFWTVLTFLLLLLILGKFAWKPILKALDERETNIKSSLEAAERAKEETRKLTDENQKILAQAMEEANKLREESRSQAESIKNDILAEAKKKSDEMLASATHEIEVKKQEALSEIKNQIADISIDIASKILKANVDKEKNKTLIESGLNEIGKN